MNEDNIDKAEQLLGYFELHGEAMTYGPEAVHREWWMQDAAVLLRDMLPEWSAFKVTASDV